MVACKEHWPSFSVLEMSRFDWLKGVQHFDGWPISSISFKGQSPYDAAHLLDFQGTARRKCARDALL